MKIYLNALKSI